MYQYTEQERKEIIERSVKHQQELIKLFGEEK
jgi:hypothetical protein